MPEFLEVLLVVLVLLLIGIVFGIILCRLYWNSALEQARALSFKAEQSINDAREAILIRANALEGEVKTFLHDLANKL